MPVLVAGATHNGRQARRERRGGIVSGMDAVQERRPALPRATRRSGAVRNAEGRCGTLPLRLAAAAARPDSAVGTVAKFSISPLPVALPLDDGRLKRNGQGARKRPHRNYIQTHVELKDFERQGWKQMPQKRKSAFRIPKLGVPL